MHTIRLGYPDSSLHEASAAAVARVLEAHELEVAYVPVASGAVSAALSDGVDLFACAWLPLTDAALLGTSSPGAGGMETIGLLYRPAFIWGVGADGPGSIADLASAPGLDRRILAPASGPIAALAERVVAAYGLAAAGYEIEALADEAELASASAGRIVAFCRPHALLHASSLRVLEDPLCALGPEQEARMLIRRDVRARLDSDLLDELDELTLGNKVVSAMAHAMRVEGLSAEEAADAWQRGKLTPRA